ncbi:MAG TPA: NAD-dependent epimerase/dehydratase family protein [Puia sp.]|nr:NAD-dependent epimerase/dehydratase family protein [Puia sp.]
MKRDTLLVVGARGQLGSELTPALRKMYGALRVVTADLGSAKEGSLNEGPYEQLDILDKQALASVISRYDITQIYLFAAKKSSLTGEFTSDSWHLNMQALLNVLSLAAERGIAKVFWPSGLSVFGPDAPRLACPQSALTDPKTSTGISKLAGELWCRYYWNKYGVDVRSLRYPGLISCKAAPNGSGVTDYVTDMFHSALKMGSYSCYLQESTALPMMYMPDAVRATLELMEAPAINISVRSSYNINAMSFSPGELALAIQRYIPDFKISYQPDHRQSVAEEWPISVDDSVAASDWKWDFAYSIPETVRHMLTHLSVQLNLTPGKVKQLHSQTYF